MRQGKPPQVGVSFVNFRRMEFRDLGLLFLAVFVG
jgi:hypothetical protein